MSQLDVLSAPTTVSELAAATGITKQGVAKRLRTVPFDTRSGGGNAVRYFPLRHLPEDLQVRLTLHRHRLSKVEDRAEPSDDTTSTVNSGTFAYDRQALWTRFNNLSETRRTRAEAKLKLINAALALVDHGVPQRQAFERIGQQSGTPWRSIEDWYQGRKSRPGCKRYHRSDWLAALADIYTGAAVRAECSDDAWAFFKADYLRLEKPGLQACYSRLLRAGAERGWQIPDDHTLLRRLKRDVPRSTFVFLRDGEQALARMFPHYERSVRDLHAMQWINGDGYQHNVFVRWPDGSVERPRTWFWQDVMSRKILAWRVDQTENADLIRASFSDVLSYGVPEHVTIDNTRAAANKWMTGGVRHRYRFKVKEDDPLGIFPMFGCKVHWTSVFNGRGHGQAKPIERAFGVGGMGEVVDKHPTFKGAYTGPNPNAKPENYGSATVKLDTFVRVLAAEIAAWNAQENRRTELGEGKYSFNQVFERSYATAPITKATEEQRQLCLLCAEAVRVQRDMTVTLSAGAIIGEGRDGRNRYSSAHLEAYVGEKVVIRFDPQELHSHVFAYTLQGGYIGQLNCLEAVGFGDTEAARERVRARNQMLRAVKAAAKAEMRMTAIEAGELLPDGPAPAVPDSSVVRMFRPAAPPRREPTPLTEEQQAIQDELIAEFNTGKKVVHVDPDPTHFYRRYLAICDAMAQQRPINDDDRAFYQGYHDSSQCRAMASFFADFPDLYHQVGGDQS